MTSDAIITFIVLVFFGCLFVGLVATIITGVRLSKTIHKVWKKLDKSLE